ncbi:MAG: PAS domain-containing protein [Candidatus Eremiobacteraeota bacterium]|nr:PAS domain-containing protein [Candidatus Eremiobacteraeota bacterium]
MGKQTATLGGLCIQHPSPSFAGTAHAAALPNSPVDIEAWRTLAETLPTVVFTAAPDGAIEFVNRRWSEFTGREVGEVVGNGWQQLVHPDDAKRVLAAWNHAIESGDQLDVTFRVRRADGEYTWAWSSAAPLRDADGKIVRWYGAAMNVDARKRAEEALHASRQELVDSERRFRALAESIPVICWTADASGWIDWYNWRWYDFTGQAPEEARGWGWQAAHHPDDLLEVMQRWPNSIETGAAFEMEFRLRRHDGVFHWFLTRAEPLRNESGKIVRWYGSNVDIDTQKRSLDRTKRVAETMQDMFLPQQLPQRRDIRIDAAYVAAEKDALVGGDWYDAFDLPDGRIVFSIGDVAGHGLEASMRVGRIRQAIYALAFSFSDPTKILARLGTILDHQDPGNFVTVLVGTIDPSHRVVAYASAGHPAPLIAYRNDEPARTLAAGGPPLGIGFPLEFQTQRVTVQPDAVVALYTDGMIEFSRDLLGTERRLKAAVALLVGDTGIARPASAVQQLVFDDQPAHDDAAILLFQFSEVAEKPATADPRTLAKTWRFHSADAYSAHATRRRIVDHLRQFARSDENVFVAELILGEMLSNTVEHAPGLVEIDLDWSDEHPVVTIRDTGPGLRAWTSRLPDNPFSEGGRGMFLMKALTEDLRVRPAAGYGTEIKATLPLCKGPAVAVEGLRRDAMQRLVRKA